VSADPLIRPFSTAIESAIADFLLTRQIEGRSPQTLRYYRQALGKFGAFVGTLPLAGLTIQVMRRFLAHLGASGLATQSQHNYVVAVKTFLRWLDEEGEYAIDVRWLDRVKPPRPVSDQTQPFTDTEIQRLFAGVAGGWMGHRLRAILALLLDTGLRVAEVSALRLCDVDLATGELHIRAATVKTREGRRTWLGLRAKKYIMRWWQEKRHLLDPNPQAAFFLGWNERPMTTRTIHRLLTRHGDRCGVPDAHPHRFRHTFTRNCIRAGLDLFQVQALLGHSDLTMTKRYFLQEQQDVSVAKRAKSPLDQIKLR